MTTYYDIKNGKYCYKTTSSFVGVGMAIVSILGFMCCGVLLGVIGAVIGVYIGNVIDYKKQNTCDYTKK